MQPGGQAGAFVGQFERATKHAPGHHFQLQEADLADETVLE